METRLMVRHAEKGTGMHLHLIINQLIIKMLPEAVRSNNVIVNDVHGDLVIKGQPALLSSTLLEMLGAMVSAASDSQITISAKAYSDVILLHIKQNSCGSNDVINRGLKKMEPLMNNIGAFLGITSESEKFTTIAFSFPNLPQAA